MANAQTIEINALTEQVFNQGKAISLQKALILQMAASDSIQVERSAIQLSTAQDKNTRLKQRLRKARLWIAGEGGLIILLVVLLI